MASLLFSVLSIFICVLFSASLTTASISLPPLPYAYDALSPYINSQTLTIHHDKHHARYVTVANELIEGTDLDSLTLEELVLKAHNEKMTALFNNAGQVFNHNFYWKSMKPNGGGAPTGRLAEMIQETFGSFSEFKSKFHASAFGLFGSGWTWLAYSPSSGLTIENTSNADSPLTQGKVPLIVIDVWEHAYYLDYQNLRTNYVATFLDNLANWEFAEQNLPKDA